MKKFNQNSRYDFSIIENWTHPNSKVLDLGCVDGALLNYLKEKKDTKGFGIEKNKENPFFLYYPMLLQHHLQLL